VIARGCGPAQRLWVLALALPLVAACSAKHAENSAPAQTAAPAPPAAQTLPPSLPSSQPAAAPATAGATRQPAATATQAAAGPSGPAIYSVSVSPTTVHAGDTVSWQARTTPDVTAVEAHVRVATLPFQKQAPGNFTMAFAVPKSVPAMFHGNYTVDVVGHTASGETVSRSVSIAFQ